MSSHREGYINNCLCVCACLFTISQNLYNYNTFWTMYLDMMCLQQLLMLTLHGRAIHCSALHINKYYNTMCYASQYGLSSMHICVCVLTTHVHYRHCTDLSSNITNQNRNTKLLFWIITVTRQWWNCLMVFFSNQVHHFPDAYFYILWSKNITRQR